MPTASQTRQVKKKTAAKAPRKAKAKAAAPSSGDIAEKIERFYDLNVARKAMEKEEVELKAFFKGLAGDKDMSFETDDYVVRVTGDSRTGIDQEKVVDELVRAGLRLEDYQKTTHFQKVTVGEKESA